MQHLYLRAAIPRWLVLVGCVLALLVLLLFFSVGSMLALWLYGTLLVCTLWLHVRQAQIRGMYISYSTKDATQTRLQLCFLGQNPAHVNSWQQADISHLRPVLGGLGVRFVVRVLKRRRAVYLFADKNPVVEWKALLRIVRLRYYSNTTTI